jgi:hypothetical protein
VLLCSPTSDPHIKPSGFVRPTEGSALCRPAEIAARTAGPDFSSSSSDGEVDDHDLPASLWDDRYLPVSTLASASSDYPSRHQPRRPHTAGALHPAEVGRASAPSGFNLLTKGPADLEECRSAVRGGSSEAQWAVDLRQRPQTAAGLTPQGKRERMKAYTPPRPKVLEPGLTVRGLGHFKV